MLTATTLAEARQFRHELGAGRKTLGLVPTMGALHQGHMSLVRASIERCDATAVSIFVNPTQFGPSEDLARYPRTLAADQKLLASAGVDMVFAPSVEQMYPSNSNTFVEVPNLSTRLDGGFRPGHFRGVVTVVAKLLNIFDPDRIFFGQKDAAQVAVVRKMLRDLNFGTRLEVCPIVRDSDGLAMSSRNRYLSAEERQAALTLPAALNAVRLRVGAGEYRSAALIAEARRALAREPLLKPEYVAIVDPDSLEDIATVKGGGLAAIAVHAGTTRLIDNLLLLAV